MTGTGLLLHDLRPVCTLFESQAVLVGRPAALADPTARPGNHREPPHGPVLPQGRGAGATWPAGWALLEVDGPELHVTHRRVGYDREAAVQDMRDELRGANRLAQVKVDEFWQQGPSAGT